MLLTPNVIVSCNRNINSFTSCNLIVCLIYVWNPLPCREKSPLLPCRAATSTVPASIMAGDQPFYSQCNNCNAYSGNVKARCCDRFEPGTSIQTALCSTQTWKTAQVPRYIYQTDTLSTKYLRTLNITTPLWP